MEAAAGSQQSQPWSSWTQTDFDPLTQDTGDLSPSIPVVVWMIDRQGHFILSEGRGLADLGLKSGEVVGKSVYDVYADVPEILECVKQALDGHRVEDTIKVGEVYWNAHFYPTRNAGGRISGVTGVAFNITTEHARLRNQKFLMDTAATLRSINSRDEMPRKTLEILHDIFQAKGALFLNRSSSDNSLNVEEFVGIRSSTMESSLNLESNPVLKERSEKILSTTHPYFEKSIQEAGSVAPGLTAAAGIPLPGRDETSSLIWILRDQLFSESEAHLLTKLGEIITGAFQRVEQFERTQERIQRLSALHAIDQAITGTFDLNVTLNVILDQVITQLEVDAADIFLYQPETHTLKFGEGRGFCHTDSSHQQVRERVGLLWQVARERALINIPNLPQRRQTFVRRSLVEKEEFITYFGIPLIAKGEIKGVLELFHRDSLQIDNEWIKFFKTLANQAAIAIDNAALFENLRKSNMKLDLAYHSTLEGWVRALDLRYEEGQGFSKRVIQRTLRLAKAFGINNGKLIHIRRGALLHDIGNLAIPDSILNKKGPLTDSEWEKIKKHPVYAQEMLSEIEFLHPALDIPYCHHEKWDGSGYPRGLKEGRIPIAARIFSIIDVWEALTSQRPYRDPWPEEKAVQYIIKHSGTHFDPEVVDAWMDAFDIEPPQEEIKSIYG